MLYIRDLIRKKRKKEELTTEELDFFVDSYYNNSILPEQISALVTLMYVNGLSYREISYLAEKISQTGKIQDLFKFSDKVLDIHPIGGIDDKIIVILLAVFATLKLPVVKIVDREIGFLDRIMDIGGYKLETQYDIIKERIGEEIVIIDEPEEIAPLELKLYKLRNDIACNDDTSLIAISLMSQKLAMGVKNIVFDITYGEKAYVKTLQDARKLAKILCQMGKETSKGVRCVITAMDEPIGKYFGNILELKEVSEALKGNMSPDVKIMVEELGNSAMQLINPLSKKDENIKLINEAIKSGSALETLEEYMAGIGLELDEAVNVVPVLSPFEGYVEEINVSAARVLAKELNAIRYSKEEYVDLGSGLEFCKKIGDRVNKGDILGVVYTNNTDKVAHAVEAFLDMYKLSNKKVKVSSRVREVF